MKHGRRRKRARRNRIPAVLLAAALILALVSAGLFLRRVLGRRYEGALPAAAAAALSAGPDPGGENSAHGFRFSIPVFNRAADGAEEGAGEGGNGVSDAESGPVTLLFGGDVYLSNYVLNAYDQAGGISGVLDEGIRAEADAADVFMVNQEFPFTERGEAKSKEYTFRLPPARVNILKEMGVDIVTLANNHILDFGPEGITDSIAALDGAGILHVGAGEDLSGASRLETVEIRGKTVGFLGASRVYMDYSWAAGAGHPGVFSAYDPAPVVRAIEAAKEVCDYLVVYIHWGVEKETSPRDYQRAMGRQFIDAGADLVIGSHPHVLQEIEYYKDKPIVHSLGNFVFGSSIPETELVKIEIAEDGEVTLTEIPCRGSMGYTRLR